MSLTGMKELKGNHKRMRFHDRFNACNILIDEEK